MTPYFKKNFHGSLPRPCSEPPTRGRTEPSTRPESLIAHSVFFLYQGIRIRAVQLSVTQPLTVQSCQSMGTVGRRFLDGYHHNFEFYKFWRKKHRNCHQTGNSDRNLSFVTVACNSNTRCACFPGTHCHSRIARSLFQNLFLAKKHFKKMFRFSRIWKQWDNLLRIRRFVLHYSSHLSLLHGVSGGSEVRMIDYKNLDEWW